MKARYLTNNISQLHGASAARKIFNLPLKSLQLQLLFSNVNVHEASTQRLGNIWVRPLAHASHTSFEWT